MLEKSIRVETMGAGRTGYCWIIDDRGIFISHPTKEFIGLNAFAARKESAFDISFEEINRIMRERMMKGESGADTYVSGWHLEEKGRIKKLIAYTPFYIGGRQYSVALVIPAAKVTLMSRKNFENTLITMAFIIVIILSGLLYILSLDRRRIEMMKREARLAEEVKESEEKYKGLFENSIDGVFTVDIEGNFTSFNKAFEEILGYSAEELIGLNYREITGVKDNDVAWKNIKEVFSDHLLKEGGVPQSP